MKTPHPALRAAATAVDCLVFYVPYVIALTDFPDPVRVLSAAVAAGILALQAWLLASRGQTLGKIATGQRLVRRSTGEKPGFLIAALARPLVAWGPNVLFLSLRAFPMWIVADGLVLTWREDGLSLHDLICGTQVVENSPTNP